MVNSDLLFTCKEMEKKSIVERAITIFQNKYRKVMKDLELNIPCEFYLDTFLYGDSLTFMVPALQDEYHYGYVKSYMLRRCQLLNQYMGMYGDLERLLRLKTNHDIQAYIGQFIYNGNGHGASFRFQIDLDDFVSYVKNGGFRTFEILYEV